MKVRPKPMELLFNDEDFENFGMTISWFPTNRNHKKLQEFQAKQLFFEDDLYDVDIEIETKKDNARIAPTSLKEMTPEEIAAYLQAQIDIHNEQNS